MRSSAFLALLAVQPWVTRAARSGETVSLEVDVDANITARRASIDVEWPKELDVDFEMVKSLACGWHGCAYLVKRRADQKMVVAKVSDDDPLETECSEMLWMRHAACNASEGSDRILALHETYVPTCEGSGTTSDGFSYLIMPMAGNTAMSKHRKAAGPLDGKKPFSLQQSKSYFAQIVASVYAMHATNLWHNDLNGGNLILDGDRLSIIDFGQVKRTPCTASRCTQGASRDGNALYRWLAVLAKCPRNARYNYKMWWFRADTEWQRRNQRAALRCIKEKWSPGQDFLAALKLLFDANVKEGEQQHIEALYNTDFVRKNLPAATKKYRIPGTENCHTWSKATMSKKMMESGASLPHTA